MRATIYGEERMREVKLTRASLEWLLMCAEVNHDHRTRLQNWHLIWYYQAIELPLHLLIGLKARLDKRFALKQKTAEYSAVVLFKCRVQGVSLLVLVVRKDASLPRGHCQS